MPRAHLTRQEGKFNFPLINKEITKLKLSFKVLKLLFPLFAIPKIYSYALVEILIHL